MFIMGNISSFVPGPYPLPHLSLSCPKLPDVCVLTELSPRVHGPATSSPCITQFPCFILVILNSVLKMGVNRYCTSPRPSLSPSPSPSPLPSPSPSSSFPSSHAHLLLVEILEIKRPTSTCGELRFRTLHGESMINDLISNI